MTTQSTTLVKSSLLIASAMMMAISLASVEKAEAAEMEKCYGVAKAGKNDCATATTSCAGTSKVDRQAEAFIAVAKGTCEKIADGHLAPMS